MGLLDMIIGCSVSPKSGVCCRPRRGVFLVHLNLESVVDHSSQGRLLSFLRNILKKCHLWSKKVIYGPDFLKSCNIWSDVIT